MALTVSPGLTARIGPPGVHLEAEDKAVGVSILPPGAADHGMWQLDQGSFVYSVVIWGNATGPQVSRPPRRPGPPARPDARPDARPRFCSRRGTEPFAPETPGSKSTGSCRRPPTA